MTRQFLLGMTLAGAALSLAACENTKKQFDFSKKAPDEFAVVTRAPLEMPPSYELRAPRPGAPRPQEISTDQLARQSVLGLENVQRTASEQGISQSEAVLLQRTGAVNANPGIRAAVDEETKKIGEEEMPGIDHLRRMVGKNVEAPAKVVDPVAEANRIKANKAQGKPVTDGNTISKED
jgi:hypothetical protein